MIRRDRVVVFRTTQTEYDRLQTACREFGARSFSDFVRSELLANIDAKSQPRPDGIAERILELQGQVLEMRCAIQDLAQILSATEIRTISRSS